MTAWNQSQKRDRQAQPHASRGRRSHRSARRSWFTERRWIETSGVIQELLSEYERKRSENSRILDARYAEVLTRSGRAAEIITGRERLFATGFREAFSIPGKAAGVADQLAKDMARVNGELREALQAEGYPSDYLEPIYRCPACRDTGYVGELIREQCVCLRQKLMDYANRNERKGGLGRHSFAQFDESVFPNEPLQGQSGTQREYMRRVRKLCERYAEDFPKTAKANLLFTGPPGLGKTFIADCIAQRVMERAFLVRRITSYRMVEIMRKHHFDGSEAATVDGLMTCDLLFIDDLGAEPMIRNVTVGYLFQIINERNNAARHTIISTNLAPAELIETYTERVVSRMLDTDRTLVLRFYGRDLRLQRRDD